MRTVPEIRIRNCNSSPVNDRGDFVLYWMIAARRPVWNFALQRAAGWAVELGKPLVVLEPLRCDYPWASDRLHRFILDGMAGNFRAFAGKSVFYYPYVEPERGAGKGLLTELAKGACLVVTDEFPAFFLPHMVSAAAIKVAVRLEAVDGNGLLPLRSADRSFPSAYLFRRFLQKNLPGHLTEFPDPDPLRNLRLPRAKVPENTLKRWPPASPESLSDARLLAAIPLDHSIPPAPVPGGAASAEEALARFLSERLERYAAGRNDPDAEATSGLSPWLHFGHISSHRIFRALADREDWTLGDLSPEGRGQRSGWWGMGEDAEAFLDQLVTWRELGYNLCAHREDYDRYESLPGWALQSLEEHGGDLRPFLYSLEDFATAATHDPLWNAAQRQLLREGTIHGYLRMLWGKKILEWSASPREALTIMIELNNRYALDGRDPNSYSGIFWCLGRYDRPWPERPIYGRIRSMSSESTARKRRVSGYLKKYGTL